MRLLMALLLCFPVKADAGAWMQEPGAYFAAVEVAIEDDQQTGMLYVEYGLRPRLTFGVASWGRKPYRGDGRVFLKFPLVNDKPYVLAGEFSLGADVEDLDITPLYRAGLSWGRGLPNGWAGLDASVTWIDGETTTKVGATYGRNLSKRLKAIGQLRFEQGTDFSYEAEASLAWQVRPNLALRAGVAQSFGDDPTTKVIVGTWITGKRKADATRRPGLLSRLLRSDRR